MNANAAVAAPRLRTALTEKTITFAGYQVDRIATGLRVATTFVVPHVKCTATNMGIAASVGMFAGSDTNTSAAEVFVGCINGKPTFFPVLTVNNNKTRYRKAKVRPGDKVVLTAVENANRTVVSVDDRTANVKKTQTGAGSPLGGNVGDPWLGDQARFSSSSEPEGVPNFGKISFSGARVAGRALGLYASLRREDRYDPTLTTLQIKTGTIATDNESFATVFKHS